MDDNIQQEIISTIPSESLKRQLKAIDYRLSDLDLLTTVFYYAPDFDTRIQHLQRLEQFFTGELKAYTARIIQVQMQMLEDFQKQTDDTVYELHIKDTPDAWDERYLCRTYEAAVQFIPLFYREYEGVSEETDAARYRIVKRRILSEGAAFSEDALGELILLPGQRIYSVDLYDREHEALECDGKCVDCEQFCVDCRETMFPSYIQHGDAVKYCDLPTGKVSFGIAFRYDDAPCSDCYVIPLSCNAVRYHDYDHLHDTHEHVPQPLVERLEAAELPEELREDYVACLQHIQKR